MILIKSINKQLITSFFKAMRPQFILYSGMLLFFSAVYWLGQLPLDLLFYTIELTAFLFLLYLLAQLYRYAKRYEMLHGIQKDNIDLENHLPKNIDPADEWYQEKILSLVAQLRETEQRFSEKNSEQLEYFTLWLHQIKTPIAAISLLMQSQPKQPLTKQVKQELLRLEDYTHMALNYLKIEESGTDLDFIEIDLDDIIKKTIKKYSIIFIYNHISLEYEDTRASVLTDGKWLQILLEQILSNSLKYTTGGTIKIYLDPEKPETLVIEDNGMGIRAEDLPRIFEKGYSGLNGRLHEKSTGLGLFLSQKIVQRLGHQLTIESVLGEGTKVFINLARKELELFD